jgi:DNA helicase-2/ATP-dependent DNA helicase PcrA
LLLDKYISLRDKLSIYELTSSLLDEIKIFEVLDDENTLESANKKENIKSFLEFIQAYRKQKSDLNLIGFLNSIMLKNGFDFIDESVNAVKVIDIHSAKNVEFPVIFITGLEEDLFPINPKYEENTTEDEEARLLYMGMTRATKRVFLTYARSRYRFGEVAYQGKSKLIDKIIPTCIKEEVGSVTRRTVDKKIDLDELFKTDEGLLKPDSKKIKVGTRLIHQVFGYGKITEVIGGGQKQKIVVTFEDGATKQIMVSMAKMKAL